LSINIKPFLFMTIAAFLFSCGCATRPHAIVTAQKETRAPEPPQGQEPTPAPEPQPAATAPEKGEPAKEAPAPVTQAPQTQTPRPTVPGAGQTGNSAPRTAASLRLTGQAKRLIESKRPDDALGILEKAINIDATNGQNYYYLAEAWIMKGNKTQAAEFNRMAGIYLVDDASWKAKIWQQKDRIGRMKNK
jgi:hypothetical protein